MKNSNRLRVKYFARPMFQFWWIPCLERRNMRFWTSVCVHAWLVGCIQLFAILRTVACQAPLSMRFPRQKYWSRLPFPSSEDLPDTGIEPTSPTLAESPGKRHSVYVSPQFLNKYEELIVKYEWSKWIPLPIKLYY